MIEVLRVTVDADKAVLPPLERALTMLPLFSAAELSTRRVVSPPGVPLKLGAGRKRRDVADAR